MRRPRLRLYLWMKRRALNVAAALAVVLCVGACVLWVRSYIVGERLVWSWASARAGEFSAFEIYSGGGGVALAYYSAAPTDPAERATMQLAVEREPLYYETRTPRYRWLRSPPRRWALGFDYLYDTAAVPRLRPIPRVAAPWWFAAAAAGALPAYRVAAPRVRRLRERRRLRAVGRCAACGYDLRATPDRCPECGAVAGATAGATAGP